MRPVHLNSLGDHWCLICKHDTFQSQIFFLNHQTCDWWNDSWTAEWSSCKKMAFLKKKMIMCQAETNGSPFLWNTQTSHHWHSVVSRFITSIELIEIFTEKLLLTCAWPDDLCSTASEVLIQHSLTKPFSFLFSHSSVFIESVCCECSLSGPR